MRDDVEGDLLGEFGPVRTGSTHENGAALLEQLVAIPALPAPEVD